MQVINDRLCEDDGRALRYIASPNYEEGLEALYLVLHYTAAPTLLRSVRWFQDSRAKASAHIIVDRTGEAIQMVPFDRRAWHAGRSRWQALEGLNAYSVGIELVNAGALQRDPGGYWVAWTGDRIPNEEVLVACHKQESFARGWHLYPDVQVTRATEIATTLHGRYRFRDVLGHDDIAPGRKLDPGPAFPMTHFAAQVLGSTVREEP